MNDREVLTRESVQRIESALTVFDTRIPHRTGIGRAAEAWPDDLYGYADVWTELVTEIGKTRT